MADRSPTIEGFRAIFRRPSLVLAEISWRWTFGAAACALLTLSLLEYLRSLPVSTGDLLFLRSRHPVLVSQALAHIFGGSGRRLVEAILLLTPALSLLWILAASFGRAATLPTLADYFGGPETKDPASSRPTVRRGLSSLLGLNSLRVALTLGGAVGILGAAIVAGFASSKTDPSPGLVFLLFLPLAALVLVAWSMLNWFLSLAPLFVTSDGRDTFSSISASTEFFRSRTGPILWSSTAFGLLHLVAFVIASSAVFTPLMFVGVLPGKVAIGAMVLLTLVYFAAVDFLYIARLAGYVCILEDSRRPPAPAPAPRALAVDAHASGLACPATIVATGTPGLQPRRMGIPASEDDILSDIPGLVPPPYFATAAASPTPAQPASFIPPSDDDIMSDVPGLAEPPSTSRSMSPQSQSQPSNPASDDNIISDIPGDIPPEDQPNRH